MSDFRTAPEFASARRHWVTSKVFEAEGFEEALPDVEWVRAGCGREYKSE